MTTTTDQPTPPPGHYTCRNCNGTGIRQLTTFAYLPCWSCKGVGYLPCRESHNPTPTKDEAA